jgi:hypothetical protein
VEVSAAKLENPSFGKILPRNPSKNAAPPPYIGNREPAFMNSGK